VSRFTARAPVERHEEAEGRVRDVPRPNFVLFHNPREWSLTGDGDLLPSLSHVSKAPGAGADPSGDFTPVRVARQKRGEVEIPTDVLGPGTHYVAQYTNQRGRPVHRTVFQEPYDGEGATRWRADADAVRKFCHYLMRIGLIKPPAPAVVRAQIARVSRLRENHLRKRPADRGARFESWEERLGMYDAQLSRLTREHMPRAVETYGDQQSPVRAALARALEVLDGGLADAPPATPVVTEPISPLAAKKPTSLKASDRAE
jgi:hypothetical protein